MTCNSSSGSTDGCREQRLRVVSCSDALEPAQSNPLIVMTIAIINNNNNNVGSLNCISHLRLSSRTVE